MTTSCPKCGLSDWLGECCSKIRRGSLEDHEAREIRDRYARGESTADLALVFAIPRSHAIAVLVGERNPDAGGPIVETLRKGRRGDLLPEVFGPKEDARRLPVLPKTRDECADVPRPCPFVSCRHHLFLEVENRFLYPNYPEIEGPEAMPERGSCVLDVVEDRGAMDLEEIGEMLGRTKERVRQIEEKVLLGLARPFRRAGIDDSRFVKPESSALAQAGEGSSGGAGDVEEESTEEPERGARARLFAGTEQDDCDWTWKIAERRDRERRLYAEPRPGVVTDSRSDSTPRSPD